MILVKNRLGKFYEQIFWEIFTNVWEIATNVWETPCPGKIVSVYQNVANWNGYIFFRIGYILFRICYIFLGMATFFLGF